LTGKFNTLAIRITQHPLAQQLCHVLNSPLISTSANLSGQPAATTWQKVIQQFPTQLDYLMKTDTLGNKNPSSIIDGITSKILRP
jgi:L-threonylcarbamoyladenylate synthase